jgi:hypothetical protein
LVLGFGGSVQVLLVRLGNDYITDDHLKKIFDTLSNLCNHVAHRPGAVLIVNGILNVIQKERLDENIYLSFINLIEIILKDEQNMYDQFSQKVSAGLIQDIASSLGNSVTIFIDQLMNLILFMLQEERHPVEVRFLAILALGEVCLHSERGFEPYIQQTMEILISTGQNCLKPIDLTLAPEEKAYIHEYRKSLSETFTSILHGILPINNEPYSPGAPSPLLNDTIKNIFFFLDTLLQIEDLKLDVEMAKYVVDLICDIYGQVTNPDLGSYSQEVIDMVVRSNLRANSYPKVAPFMEMIGQIDPFTVDRYQQYLQHT